MAKRETSSIFLPLHTSVELFSDPAQPPAIVRAKQAAVLHDHLYVEGGYLDVSITDSGSSTWWTPPDQITQDKIARARNPTPAGAAITLAMGAQAGPGQPATQMRTVMAGEISVAYGAEWHSEVLDPLKQLGVDWFEELHIGAGDIPRRDPVGDAIARQNYKDWTDRSLLPGVNEFRRNFIYKAFNRDAAVAEDLGAAFHITSLFEPMLMRHGYEPDPSGGTALQIAAPNLGALPWETIAEFREHPGAEEARALIMGFEQRAADEEPQDARDFLLKVSQQVTDGLFAALQDKRTKVPRVLAEEAAKTGISLIPAALHREGRVGTSARGRQAPRAAVRRCRAHGAPQLSLSAPRHVPGRRPKAALRSRHGTRRQSQPDLTAARGALYGPRDRSGRSPHPAWAVREHERRSH
jgi:hypothetical protein